MSELRAVEIAVDGNGYLYALDQWGDVWRYYTQSGRTGWQPLVMEKLLDDEGSHA